MDTSRAIGRRGSASVIDIGAVSDTPAPAVLADDAIATLDQLMGTRVLADLVYAYLSPEDIALLRAGTTFRQRVDRVHGGDPGGLLRYRSRRAIDAGELAALHMLANGLVGEMVQGLSIGEIDGLVDEERLFALRAAQVRDDGARESQCLEARRSTGDAYIDRIDARIGWMAMLASGTAGVGNVLAHVDTPLMWAALAVNLVGACAEGTLQNVACMRTRLAGGLLGACLNLTLTVRGPCVAQTDDGPTYDLRYIPFALSAAALLCQGLRYLNGRVLGDAIHAQDETDQRALDARRRQDSAQLYAGRRVSVLSRHIDGWRLCGRVGGNARIDVWALEWGTGPGDACVEVERF